MVTGTGSYQCREIFARAVCGKGRKFSQSTHTITPETTPANILGAWVINHHYDAKKSGDYVTVTGTYDIDVWYATEGNKKTEVAKETISFTEHIPLSFLDENLKDDDVEVAVSTILEPNCVEASLTSDHSAFVVEVEREYLAEVIGETKLKVLVCPDEDWADKDFDFQEEEDFFQADDEEAELLLSEDQN